jgi:hypothetical protein
MVVRRYALCLLEILDLAVLFSVACEGVMNPRRPGSDEQMFGDWRPTNVNLSLLRRAATVLRHWRRAALLL